MSHNSELAARLEKNASLFPGMAADLRAAAQAVREREWRPIAEAPKDRWIDAWDGFDRVADVKYNTRTGSWFSDVFSCGDMDWREMDPQPKYWLEIPAPPEVGG